MYNHMVSVLQNLKKKKQKKNNVIINRGEDFRPKYKEVSTIRSFLSHAPVCILTATTTRKVMDSVLDTLMLSNRIEVVAIVPDRYGSKPSTLHINLK